MYYIKEGQQSVEDFHKQRQFIMALLEEFNDMWENTFSESTSKTTFERMQIMLDICTNDDEWNNSLLHVLVLLQKFVDCWIMNIRNQV